MTTCLELRRRDLRLALQGLQKVAGVRSRLPVLSEADVGGLTVIGKVAHLGLVS